MSAPVRWLEALREAIARGERATLVVVAAASGSTPREPGAAMVVRASAATGTIGGGHLEFEAIRLAREALADTAAPSQWLVRFPLAARLGQCCGGVATLAFSTVDASALPWLDVALACERAGAPFAIVGRLGASPQDAARLVVTADDARGSLGEAALDSAAIVEARARLRDEAAGPRGTGVADTLGETLFVHVERPEPFVVCVFGNGHVGRALVHVLGAIDADVRWIDARESDFPLAVPANVTLVPTDDPEDEVVAAPRGAYLVVLTHSHALDYAIVEAALAREDLAYVGLIGSRSKRAQFERRFAARGMPAPALARLTCPIGSGPLRGKAPGVIAIAVAAELLRVREARIGSEAAPATVARLPSRGARRG